MNQAELLSAVEKVWFNAEDGRRKRQQLVDLIIEREVALLEKLKKDIGQNYIETTESRYFIDDMIDQIKGGTNGQN